MLVYPWKNGVVLDTGLAKFAVDVPKPVPGAVHLVTHAHADHIGAARKTEVLTTPGTHEILKTLKTYGSRPILEGKPLHFGSAQVFFVPAGHIPGSAQVVIDNGSRILVTGDFKVEPDVLEPGADIVDEVDILILETTFGAPQYQFPQRPELYDSIERWVKTNLSIGRHVALFGYAIGKSQELTALLNSFGVTPIVPERTHQVNSLLGLKDIPIGSEGWREAVREPSVFILPPRFSDVLPSLELELGRKFVARSCSGWARKGFQLSSHADFWQTVEFVNAIEPKMILTYGGNAEQMAIVLRRMGFDAKPLRNSIFV